jgi:galactokinase
LASIHASYKRKFGRLPEVVVRAPGRVNLIGAHVDYNEGWVLPGAIDRSVWVAAGRRSDSLLSIESLDLGGRVDIELSMILESIPASKDEPGWSKFPFGVAWALSNLGWKLPGMNAVFMGDIPIGAGVSSSAAVEIAFIMAFEYLSGSALSGRQRAEIGQLVENDYLGVASGIMDQYASVHGKAENLILLDCRSIEHELIALPSNIGVIVADSGVRRELVNSEYNLRREQCQQALSILQQELPDIKALRDVSIEEFHHLSMKLPKILRMRSQHVIEECARVLEGVQALKNGDLEHFGDTMIRSHLSSRALYEVSIDELDALAEAAWDLPGCFGARLTGAGFGGCVAAIVDRESSEDVSKVMSAAFNSRFGRNPTIFTCNIADGASYLFKSDW